mgnify:CR=1 FL=1
MFWKRKYKVHVYVENNGWGIPELCYVIQRKIFGIWWTVSEEMKNERYAKEMCERLMEEYK